ncbi:MAG: hypothetical protein ABW189_04840 [Rickettsiales bacterium]
MTFAVILTLIFLSGFSSWHIGNMKESDASLCAALKSVPSDTAPFWCNDSKEITGYNANANENVLDYARQSYAAHAKWKKAEYFEFPQTFLCLVCNLILHFILQYVLLIAKKTISDEMRAAASCLFQCFVVFIFLGYARYRYDLFKRYAENAMLALKAENIPVSSARGEPLIVYAQSYVIAGWVIFFVVAFILALYIGVQVANHFFPESVKGKNGSR